jgi:hypothetical protein
VPVEVIMPITERDWAIVVDYLKLLVSLGKIIKNEKEIEG